MLLKSLVVLTAGCASPAAVTPTAAPKLPAAPATLSGVSAWQTILDAARKEGSVLMYGTLLGGDDATKLSARLKQDTGIGLDFIPLQGGPATTRIREEIKAGKGPDIFEASGGWVGAMSPDGAFTALKGEQLPVWSEPDDVWHAHPGYKSPNDYQYVLSRMRPKNGHITVNTNQLGAADYPKSWNDLASNPKYKGKVVWSDPVATTGSSVLWTMDGYVGKDLTPQDFWGLARGQDTLLLQQSRAQFVSVAQGERAICVAGADESVLDLVAAGAPILNLFFPGAHNYAQSADMAVLKSAPHPNAAFVFVNWYLSKNGQDAICSLQQVASIRRDTQDYVAPALKGQVIGGGPSGPMLMEAPLQTKFASDLQQGGVFGRLGEGSTADDYAQAYAAFVKDWEARNGGPQDQPLLYRT